MKKILFISALFFVCLGTLHAEIKYSGAGAGAQIGLVIAETWQDVLPAAAFGFGAQGLVEVDFGRIGKVQYIPSLTFWFRSDDTPSSWWDVKYRHKDGMIAIDFLDLKYLPPVKESMIVKPYIGFGPAIVVHTWGYEYIHSATTGNVIDKNSFSDADAAFNIFIGSDFMISKVFAPYVEFRGVLSNKKVFKINIGANILF